MPKKSITDYTPDKANANRGTARGQKMVDESIKTLGAGRSVVVDADGNIIAGKKTTEAAKKAGITEVIEIESEGEVLIVHKRKDLRLYDLADPRARQLAYVDNQSSQIGLDWDVQQITQDLEAGIDLTMAFNEQELDEFQSDADIEEFIESSLEENRESRTLTDGDKLLKLAVFTSDLGTIERAIRATGEKKRATALTRIFEFYLLYNGDPDE